MLIRSIYSLTKIRPIDHSGGTPLTQRLIFHFVFSPFLSLRFVLFLFYFYGLLCSTKVPNRKHIFWMEKKRAYAGKSNSFIHSMPAIISLISYCLHSENGFSFAVSFFFFTHFLFLSFAQCAPFVLAASHGHSKHKGTHWCIIAATWSHPSLYADEGWIQTGAARLTKFQCSCDVRWTRYEQLSRGVFTVSQLR